MIITRDKNKLKSKAKSKILVLGLILTILFGLFGPMVEVNAQIESFPGATSPTPSPSPTPTTPPATPAATPPATPEGPKEGKNDYVGGCAWDFWDHIDDCILAGGYYIFFTVPTLLLYVTAKFFNFMVVLSISNTATGLSGFVSAAWAVVRDFSNIFFILVLLYVAIQTILGMGHETKKIIVHVIIMALLINFSLFFTKVVIDSSNILALVFYNKLEVNQSRPYDSTFTKNKEKDISGEIYDRFNPTTVLLNGDLFKKMKDEAGAGKLEVFGYKMGMMLVAFAVMMAAIYLFIVSAFMFLGRLVELWVLMIFSPFAFMSWTIPQFAGVEYLGWNAWLKRLISTSFMAPIYMFFLYLIFKLWGDPSVFSSLIKPNGEFWATIVGVLIPAGIIIVLLRKAVDIAKKGGGAVGEKFSKGIEALGGLAVTAGLAATTGGAALALRAGVGGAGGALLNKAAGKGTGRIANSLRSTSSFLRDRSFDVRNAPGAIKNLAKSSGGMFAAQEGGWEGAKKRIAEKRAKRADEVVKKETEEKKKGVENAEIILKEATLPVKLKLENADRLEKEAREEMKDAKITDDSVAFDKAKQKFHEAKNEKTKIKNTFIPTKEGLTTINAMEEAVRNAKYDLESEGGNIRIKIATKLEEPTGEARVWRTIKAVGTLGNYIPSAEKEAARQIRLGAGSSGGKKKDEEKMNTPKPKDIKVPPPNDSAHPPTPGGHPTT